ncbi:hypothetical protein RIF29_10915 [Crotalaria pallida]|uniref:Amino acid transporter transmembrane domain-containing protein n=1 Tax=Crotalaria pallida TaxID=3830 RepID=A0AAN9FTD6_CROPI
MVENNSTTNHSHHLDFDAKEDPQDSASPIPIDSKYYDDDGHPKRTGNVWTTSSHIITAVIGSGVLSLSWAMAQMGWIAGPVGMIFFSIITWYTSSILAECYRTGDPNTGRRNYTFMDSISSILGGFHVMCCGIVQYSNLFGTAIGYTIAASISMIAIKKSTCIRSSDGKDPCHGSGNPYMIFFGIVQIFVSQIPDFDKMWWLSILASVMSFTYSIIGLALGVAKLTENRAFKGSLAGVSIETVTVAEKTWGFFQALGNIAFAYSFSMILIEIQDTIKNPPSEVKTMKKAAKISIAVTTTFYLLCGGMGYAAFGDDAPGNLLTGFGTYNPFRLIDIANAAIVIHLVGGYQIFAQPLFAYFEKEISKRWAIVDKEYKIPIPGFGHHYNLNVFRLVWRTAFVIVTTFIAMLIPFFNDVLGVIGAMGFWPLTVYYPVEMYITQRKIPKWSRKWILLEMMSAFCFIVTVAALIGSVVGILINLKQYKTFSLSY